MERREDFAGCLSSVDMGSKPDMSYHVIIHSMHTDLSDQYLPYAPRPSVGPSLQLPIWVNLLRGVSASSVAFANGISLKSSLMLMYVVEGGTGMDEDVPSVWDAMRGCLILDEWGFTEQADDE